MSATRLVSRHYKLGLSDITDRVDAVSFYTVVAYIQKGYTSERVQIETRLVHSKHS